MLQRDPHGGAVHAAVRLFQRCLLTLRSGGKTLITFFFDSCYTWLINFPIAFVLSRYTALPLPIVYLFVNGVDLLKCIIGFILVKKGVWVNNIVASSQDVPQAD